MSMINGVIEELKAEIIEFHTIEKSNEPRSLSREPRNSEENSFCDVMKQLS